MNRVRLVANSRKSVHRSPSQAAGKTAHDVLSTPESLGGFLARSVKRFEWRPALLWKPRYRTEVWSYRQLWERSSIFMGLLLDRGLVKGDRVILWAPNSPWWVAAYFGCLRLGVIVVPLDLRCGTDFVQQVVRQTEPTLAILAMATLHAWTAPTPIVTLENLASLPTVDSLPDAYQVNSDDIAELMYTSGTTGTPKGVMLTHGNIIANVSAVNAVIHSGPHLRLLSVLPLSHMFEQTIGLLLPLLGGASVFYPATRQSSVIFRDFQRQKITTMLLVPQALDLFLSAIKREVERQGKLAMWQRLLQLAEHVPVPVRRHMFRGVHSKLGGMLRFIVSGGAPLDPVLAHTWEMLGIRVLQGYGATECAPAIAGTSFEDRNHHSVGKALPGVEVTLGEDGEIIVRGPNVTPGYWRDPKATQEVLANGWYKTGDLGEIDAHDYVYLHGRKKDLIVLANGQNVFPEDVERVLRAIPGVADTVVVGMPSEHGSRVHAVLRCDTGANPAALVRQANSCLEAHQAIQAFSVWTGDDFPRTHTMKVKKGEVQAETVRSSGEHGLLVGTSPLLGGGEPQRASGVCAVPLYRLVADAAHVAIDALRPEATLGEGVGLDSLGRVELLATIETEYGAELDESRVSATTTLRDLERMIEAKERGARPEFPAWPLTPLAKAVRGSVQPLALAPLRAITPLTIQGLENIRGVKPPVLLVANHASHLDTPTLLRAIPTSWRRRMAVAAAADYFFTRPILGSGVALLLNAFPFSRSTAIRPTLGHCAHLVDRGWSILLYPEGTRASSGEIAAFKSGVGLLAIELSVPVVPACLVGLDRVLPRGRRIPKPAQVRVIFGSPLQFGKETPYERAAAEIEAAVRALVSQTYGSSASSVARTSLSES